MFERTNFLRDALAASAAVDAADRLGVITRLHNGPADAPALARDCGIGERGAQALLSALAGLGLVEAAGDGSYSAAAPGLVRLPASRRMWHHLAEAIREDLPIVAGDTPAGAEAHYPDMAPYLGELLAPLAEKAAAHLETPGPRVLDVGAGAAPWSLALAARDPACLITALDLPAVLPATRSAVAAAGRGAQFRFLAGDLFTVDWGSSAYDLAIAGNLCHLFDEGPNQRLLCRLFDALRPGGRLAIIDALPNERSDGPPAVVLYALGLLLRTTRGRVYPFSTYVRWLHEAGFEGIERFELTAPASLSLITARRPPEEGESRL